MCSDSKLSEELIRDAVDGSREAIGRIIEFYDRRLTCLVAKRLQSRFAADIDEVVQNVRVKIMQSVSRFQWRGSFEGFIFQIARFTVIEFFRDRRTDRGSSLDAIQDEYGSVVEPTDDNMQADAQRLVEVHDLLEGFRKTLSESDQLVMDLYVSFEEQREAIAEIALRLGIEQRQARDRQETLLDQADRYGRRLEHPRALSPDGGDKDGSMFASKFVKPLSESDQQFLADT